MEITFKAPLSLLCCCKSFLQRCGLSRSHFYFLYLVRLFWKNLSRIRLFQITSIFFSLGAAVLEKSLKDAVAFPCSEKIIPPPFLISFLWCNCYSSQWCAPHLKTSAILLQISSRVCLLFFFTLPSAFFSISTC